MCVLEARVGVLGFRWKDVDVERTIRDKKGGFPREIVRKIFVGRRAWGKWRW